MTGRLMLLSDRLVSLRLTLDRLRGEAGIPSSAAITSMIEELDAMVGIALHLEARLDRLDWNERAAAERALLLDEKTVVVLDAFRPAGNIIAFPRSRRMRYDEPPAPPSSPS